MLKLMARKANVRF